MFDLIHSLSMESRQALFSTVMDVYRSGRREVSQEDFLASLLRVRSVAAALPSSADISGLMERLGAPAAGTGTYEALSHWSDHAEIEEDQSLPTPFASVGIPAEGGFVAVPLASGAKDVFELVRAEFLTAPPESVTPWQMLTSLLRSDSALRSLCAQFGVQIENIERV